MADDTQEQLDIQPVSPAETLDLQAAIPMSTNGTDNSQLDIQTPGSQLNPAEQQAASAQDPGIFGSAVQGAKVMSSGGLGNYVQAGLQAGVNGAIKGAYGLANMAGYNVPGQDIVNKIPDMSTSFKNELQNAQAADVAAEATHPSAYKVGEFVGATAPLGFAGGARAAAEPILSDSEALAAARNRVGNFNPNVQQVAKQIQQQAGNVTPEVTNPVSGFAKVMGGAGAVAGAKLGGLGGAYAGNLVGRAAAPIIEKGIEAAAPLAVGANIYNNKDDLIEAKNMPKTLTANNVDQFQQQLGGYYPILKQAAMQGGNNLAVQTFVLQQKDPQFNKLYTDMQNQIGAK